MTNNSQRKWVRKVRVIIPVIREVQLHKDHHILSIAALVP